MIPRVLIIAVVASILLPGASVAQTITVNNNLIFGNMFPGIPKNITKYTVGAAAEFHVAGTNAAEISIQFTLPKKMTKTGIDIQLIFFQTSCSIDPRPNPRQDSPLTDNLNPWSVITDRLGTKGLVIWLGGMAVPRIVQPPGSYSASITLTVAYTGN